MRVQVQVDADEFWPSLAEDVAAAKDYVYIQSLSYEGDRVGKAVSQCMIESRAAERRIIADEFYTRHRINDKYLHNPKHWLNKSIRHERDETLAMMRQLEARGVRVKLTNPSGPLNLRTWQRNHKKIIVVDDRVSYIGGINFSEHNFEWHDMMLRITDPDVTRFLKSDFLATWDGSHLNTSNQFDGMEIYRFDGRTNARTFEPILDMISGAEESIYIESPYITFPFYERLVRARRNGAKVVLVTPANNNWITLREYSLWDSRRGGIDILMYPDRMSHLKAMLIDNKYLIVGSSNFDFLTYGFLQEIVAVITDPDTIMQYKQRVLLKDLEKSTAPTTRIGDFKGYYHHVRLKLLSWIFRAVGGVIALRK